MSRRGSPSTRPGVRCSGAGFRFVEGIDGSYSNVVGLPISNVYDLLKELGCDILGSKEIPVKVATIRDILCRTNSRKIALTAVVLVSASAG
jgi:hypothetical protein